tara:strand:- start:4458 stop:4829 length:372 start_codon:yes stop_codon:yes gene_type:complete
MLRGFEKITVELTDDELKKVPTIVKGIQKRIGKENAVTSKIICDKMNLIGVRLRKIIHYIRVKNLISGLCSNSKGYYVAKNIKELEDNNKSLQQRIASQIDILNALERQTIMFGGTGEQTDFE